MCILSDTRTGTFINLQWTLGAFEWFKRTVQTHLLQFAWTKDSSMTQVHRKFTGTLKVTFFFLLATITHNTYCFLKNHLYRLFQSCIHSINTTTLWYKFCSQTDLHLHRPLSTICSILTHTADSSRHDYILANISSPHTHTIYWQYIRHSCPFIFSSHKVEKSVVFTAGGWRKVGYLQTWHTESRDTQRVGTRWWRDKVFCFHPGRFLIPTEKLHVHVLLLSLRMDAPNKRQSTWRKFQVYGRHNYSTFIGVFFSVSR